MDDKDNFLLASIKEVYRKKGLKICFIALVAFALICWVCHLLWNYKINVHVEPIGSNATTLEYDKEIPIVKKSSVAGQYSVVSPLGELFSGINDTTQAIDLANSFSDLYSATKIEKKLIHIPKGTGCTHLEGSNESPGFGNFSIYLWKESGEYWLFKRKYAELHAVMIYDDTYIHAYGQVETLGLNVVTEIGNLQE